MDVEQVKQTIYAELLEAKHDAENGKFRDLSICQHRSKGYRARWELQVYLREKLDSIGGLDKALHELIQEEKVEEQDHLYRVKQ